MNFARKEKYSAGRKWQKAFLHTEQGEAIMDIAV